MHNIHRLIINELIYLAHMKFMLIFFSFWLCVCVCVLCLVWAVLLSPESTEDPHWCGNERQVDWRGWCGVSLSWRRRSSHVQRQKPHAYVLSLSLSAPPVIKNWLNISWNRYQQLDQQFILCFFSRASLHWAISKLYSQWSSRNEWVAFILSYMSCCLAL